nr:ABC transporter ATP-binding protein [Dyella silvatica]
MLDEFGRLGQAFKQLFGAQLSLLRAELGLARRAISWMLVAALAATVAGVGLGLTLLGLIGVLLAKWFGSWVGALAVLALLQLLFLLVAVMLFRRCMHWLSLPVTRSEWGSTMRDIQRKSSYKAAETSREGDP